MNKRKRKRTKRTKSLYHPTIASRFTLCNQQNPATTYPVKYVSQHAMSLDTPRYAMQKVLTDDYYPSMLVSPVVTSNHIFCLSILIPESLHHPNPSPVASWGIWAPPSPFPLVVCQRWPVSNSDFPAILLLDKKSRVLGPVF